MRRCWMLDQGFYFYDISMLVCQTLDFIFGILGLVNKMPNLSSWDFILVTLGIPKPQTLDFISGNGLECLVIHIWIIHNVE